MNMTQVGKFIADLRKEHKLTQEQLGEKLGVTNKTISRWETGTYLPPADSLLRMSELFEVSINEILSGKLLTDSEYKKAAEENLVQALRVSGFSLKERIDYYKHKWLKDHVFILIIIGFCILSLFVFGLLIKKPILVSVTPLLVALAHVWRYNTMMVYVESHVYD